MTLPSQPTKETTIDAGTYNIRVQCPACGLVEDVEIILTAILTRTVAKAELGVRLAQRKIEHGCGQLRLVEVNRVTGEMLDFPDGVAAP